VTEVLGAGTGCIGTSDDRQTTLCTFVEVEVARTNFIQQGGKNEHGAISELLALLPPARRDGMMRATRGRRVCPSADPRPDASLRVE
jgi:hypothetical protein